MEKDLISCSDCERLAKFRVDVAGRDRKYANEMFWSKPVPGYGDINGRLIIVGLAPAAMGGNRTGRVFTGDKSSDFLVSCLYEAGFTNQPTSERKDDGLQYIDSYITAAVKCVPPDNKPTLEEIRNCSKYLRFEIRSARNARVILALGKIAFDAVISSFSSEGYGTKGTKFVHGNKYAFGNITVVASYHPSPRNVNTGKLSREKFMSILYEIRDILK